MKNVIRTALLVSAIAVATTASAQFGNMPSLGGASSGTPAADPAQIIKSMNQAVASLNSANAAYFEAFGMKEKADAARRIAEQMRSGSLGVESGISQTKAISEDLFKAVNEKNEQKVKLSESAKSKLSEGLAHHVAGTVEGIKGGKQFKSAMSSPAALASLSSVTAFPGLLQSWTSSTSQVLTVLSYNGIDTRAAEKSIKQGMAD